MPGLLALILAGLLLHPMAAEAAPAPEPVPAPTDCIEANIYYGSVPPGGDDAEVLVFVHGYQGLAVDWWYYNFASGFNAMYDLAYAAGYRTAFINTNARLDASPCNALRKPTHSVLDAGGVVATQLDLISAHYGVDQVSVIAHSKGGIDTQMAMAFHGQAPRVKNLITLSSPHRGEILADLVWSTPFIRNLLEQFDFFTLDEGFRSVRETSMKVLRLYVDNLDIHDGTSYFSAGGTGWQGSGGLTEVAGQILQFIAGDNDGVVTVASTDLPYKLPFFVADYNHNEMYQGDEAWPYIVEVLQAAPAAVSLEGPASTGTGSDYTFTATVDPLSLTMPLTTTWEATGFPTTVITGARTSSQVYGWDSVSSQTITVTMENIHGSATTVWPVQVVGPTPFTPPAAVVVTGPATVTPGETATFTATVSPANVTRDVEYLWQVTGQSNVVHYGGPTDSISFTWTGTGAKTVQVFATSNGVTKSANTSVQVARAPAAVSITGPTQGATGSNLVFTASVSNGNATLPLTFEWRTADFDSVTHVVNSTTDNVTFNYLEAGVQPLSVRASNAAGGAVDFRTVEVSTGPTVVTVTGEAVGAVNTTSFFTAEVGPEETSVPVTYTWTTTGTPPSLVTTGDLLGEAGFTWSSPGTKTVNVNAANQGGSAAGATSINILPASPTTPPGALALDGPSRGLTQVPYTFVASVTPITATQPITYTWAVEGQDELTHSGGGNDVVEFTWPLGGTYQLVVTATNAFGAASASQSITLITPVSSLSEAWPDVIAVNQPVEFTVNALPLTATTPVTYTWWTPELPAEVIQVGGLTNSFSYTWSATGPTALSVKAENGDAIVHVDKAMEVVEPVSGVGLTGPSIGGVGIAYPFTATALPANATTPLEYLWEATDHPPLLRSGDISDVASFSWDTLGPKTITVTVNNGLQPYSATFMINVAGYPPAGLDVSGPVEGVAGAAYAFTATVSPPDVYTPVTYTWEATGLPPVVHVGTNSDQALFNWPTPGQKTVTVTAANLFSAISQTHTIDLASPYVAPSEVTLVGSGEGVTGTGYTFTATVTPGGATQPITYTWQATGQPLMIHVAGTEDSVIYNWSSGGVKSITVTATNAGGEVSDAGSITIRVPMSGVNLSGLTQGLVDTTYSFTATVSPGSATTPITYTWAADEHTVVVRPGERSDVISFSWSSPGEKNISVAADNGANVVTDDLTITVAEPPNPPLFLPLLLTGGAGTEASAPSGAGAEARAPSPLSRAGLPL